MCSMCWTAEEDKGDDEAELAATHILSYGQNTMGIGYMELWGFWAKRRIMDLMDRMLRLLEHLRC